MPTVPCRLGNSSNKICGNKNMYSTRLYVQQSNFSRSRLWHPSSKPARPTRTKGDPALHERADVLPAPHACPGCTVKIEDVVTSGDSAKHSAHARLHCTYLFLLQAFPPAEVAIPHTPAEVQLRPTTEKRILDHDIICTRYIPKFSQLGPRIEGYRM